MDNETRLRSSREGRAAALPRLSGSTACHLDGKVTIELSVGEIDPPALRRIRLAMTGAAPKADSVAGEAGYGPGDQACRQ